MECPVTLEANRSRHKPGFPRFRSRGLRLRGVKRTLDGRVR